MSKAPPRKPPSRRGRRTPSSTLRNSNTCRIMGHMEYTHLPPGLLTTNLAAMACGVDPATIRDWVRRGLLHRCGGSPRRPIYRLDDVIAAKTSPKPTRAGQRATR